MVGAGGVRESFAKSRDAVVNREQKIALIVGFAVVLVVGVLVSDHLSGARNLQLADATEGDAGRIEAAPIAYLPDRDRSIPRIASPDADRDTAVQPIISLPESTPEPFTFVQGGGGDQSPLGEVLSAGDANDQRSPAESPTWKDSLRGFGEQIARGLDNGVREAAVIERADDRSAVSILPSQARPVEVEPVAKQVRHVVQANESLYKIAKRYLGDGNRWRELAAANTGKVGKDGSVRTGVSLVIPGATPRATPPVGTPESAPARTSAPIRYTVQKNDSLSEISQRYLGTTKRMAEIIAANRSQIDDPDDIRIGMVLTIPAKS